MKFTKVALSATVAVIAALSVTPSFAADKVRVASAQKGFWDTTLILFGSEKGLFKKHNIELDLIYTDGGADAQQAVIAGSMDVAVATGTLGVLSAWSKRAPIAIISAEATGSPDISWFVKKDSPIKSPKDLEGKSVGYSRPGSSSHLIAQKVVDDAGVKAKLVSTGGPPATLTAVMSGQVDVGWMAPPMHAALLEKGDIRTLFTGNSAPGVKDQTVRVNAANVQWLEKNADVARRFLAGYRDVIDWAYAGDEAAQTWADMHKISLAQAKSFITSNYPKEMLQLATIGALDLTIQEAIETKRLDKPLSEAQKKELVKWVGQLNKAP